jgi:hypothetical protein
MSILSHPEVVMLAPLCAPLQQKRRTHTENHHDTYLHAPQA